MKLFAIEGNTQKLDGGAMFGNAPKEMWQQWVDVDDKNRINLACRALLVILDNGKKLLFETGVGAFFEDKLKERYGIQEKEHILIENLKALKMDPDDIDYVILSHLHFDHAGGTLSAYDDGPIHLLFKKAKYLVSKKHWERALNPHPRDKASFIPLLNQLLQESGRLILVDSETIPELKPYVSFLFSEGHTPGLMLSQIYTPQGPLLFASDLIPGAAWMHTSLSMGYDRYPELVIDEKKTILEDLLKKNGLIFFTHDTKNPLSKVCQDGKGKFYADPIEIRQFH